MSSPAFGAVPLWHAAQFLWRNSSAPENGGAAAASVVEIGKAKISREGNHVTVIAWGAMVPVCVEVVTRPVCAIDVSARGRPVGSGVQVLREEVQLLKQQVEKLQRASSAN